MPEGWLCVVRWSRAIGKCTGHRPPIRHCSPSWRATSSLTGRSTSWYFRLMFILPMPCACWKADASRSARRTFAPNPAARSPAKWVQRCSRMWAAAMCIVGHSERRRWYHEDDALVARKFAAALAGDLTPVLCVGETLEEREAHHTEAVVGRQVDAVIAMHGIGGFAAAVLAYEPVWAIGTGRTASPEQAQAVHAFLRSRISAHDAKIGGPSADSLRRQRKSRQCGRTFCDA